MCSKRVRCLGIGGAVFAGVLAAGAAPASGQDRFADGIAAVVNDRIITLVDVRIVEAFGIVETASPAGTEAIRREILEKLINQKVVLDLSRGLSAVEPDRIAAEIGRISDRLGEEKMRELLGSFGFTETELEPYLEEKMRVDAVIADRFDRSVTVNLNEIEAVYESRYAPAESSAGRTPRPFLDVVDALEKEIKAEKVAVQSTLWVQSLREQAEIEIRADVLKK
ncbi:MAG: SurA N-terminal domain-containing protein [Candidatus Aminicenantales bacterium]